MKTEILFGIHPVNEALKAGRRVFTRIYISKEKTSNRAQSIISCAGSRKIPVSYTARSDLNDMAGTDGHQGICAQVSTFPLSDTNVLTTPHGFSRSNHSNAPGFVLILDQIVDTHNLGALIRTAVCTGVQAIILPKDRSACPTPAVSKASAGAMEHAEIIIVTNIVSKLTELKQAGMWISALIPHEGQSVFRADFSIPTALMIGGEEKGIRPLVKKHCDFMISIPQHGPVDSLNASVAGAVVMYEVFRQRINLK